jgi:hypothetical protein
MNHLATLGRFRYDHAGVKIAFVHGRSEYEAKTGAAAILLSGP